MERYLKDEEALFDEEREKELSLKPFTEEEILYMAKEYNLDEKMCEYLRSLGKQGLIDYIPVER